MDIIKEYWYLPILILLFSTSIILTIRLKGIQFRKLGLGIKLMFDTSKEGEGEISSFAALCVSLSATIGTGNIIGVATSIAIGGAGALVWMIIIALFSLSTKYAEGYLAIKHRKFLDNGEVTGGPFAYIEYGLGKKYLPLARTFAIFASLAALLGTGTMTQSNGIVESFNNVINSVVKLDTVNIFGNNLSIVSIIIGIIVTLVSGMILFGGIKRISKFCEFVVPFMAIIYIISCLLIIGLNFKNIPDAFLEMITLAIDFKSITGGVVGYTILNAIINGAQKGIFANEAGLGSTPIALSSAKTKDPIKQGLISMGGMAVTMIICLMTGLVVILTGAHQVGKEGINITNHAFTNGLIFHPIFSSIILLLCVVFFAITTIVGWEVYGHKCIGYLTNNNKYALKIYLILYIFAVLVGAFLKVDLIWNIADVCNALMAIPNLIAILLLSKELSKDTNNDLYGVNKRENW